MTSTVIGKTMCHSISPIRVNQLASMGNEPDTKPPTSNQPSCTAKTLIKSAARKKVGKEIPIIEKMVTGRIGKFYDNNCLLDMSYVKDDEIKVGKYVENTAKELGTSIKVTGFHRFEKGEGIQKREENFADEIAKLTNKQ